MPHTSGYLRRGTIRGRLSADRGIAPHDAAHTSFILDRTLTAMPNKELHTLLLIHGYPLDASMWNDQVEGLKDVAQVIAPDLRGFGNDRRDIPGVMSMDAHAQDLKEMLDERGIERVVLCGLSMGGYIALAFLERWPERVEALVLANTKATADDAEARAGREQSAINATTKGMAVIARAMGPKLLTEDSRANRPELVARVETMIARQEPETAAASARGMALRPDKLQWMKDIGIPILVITGDADELMPIPTSEAMAQAVPNSRLVVLPEAGHLSNMERAEDFNAAIRNFLLAV